MPLSYIGIGSNLGDSAAIVVSALACLGELGEVRARSSLYRTRPWGRLDQPTFVNAVALLDTRESPHGLLAALQALESCLGRTPGERYGPRVIDLDILTYDALVVATADLQIPHPRLSERAFVLVPLAEIDGDYAPLRDALARNELASVERLETGLAG